MERARVINASSNLSKEFIHYANEISNPFLHESESNYIRRLNGVGTATGAGCAAIGLAGVIGGGLSGAAEYCP